MPPSSSTRERLIDAMARSLRRKGLHGTGVTELLAQAQAPKGVLYHHFPGGKTELAVAAIDAAIERLLAALQERLDAGVPLPDAFAQWVQGASRQLERSGWETGCPMAAVALESGPQDGAIRDALARGFDALRGRLAAALQGAGIDPDRARRLAALVVATYEGGLMQARVAASALPLHDATDMVVELLNLELDRSRR